MVGDNDAGKHRAALTRLLGPRRERHAQDRKKSILKPANRNGGRLQGHDEMVTEKLTCALRLFAGKTAVSSGVK